MNQVESVARNSRSESFRRLNPELYAKTRINPTVRAVEANKSKSALALPLAKAASKLEKRKGRVAIVITLIAVMHRQLDSDNLAAACKPLRDAVSATLGIDDGSPVLRWEYGQVETRGEQGVIVKIEAL